MAHRAHLFSLRVGDALRQSCFERPYGIQQLKADLIAGVTVGVIAIPLSMALAIASGVPPQHGLYTAMIAGLVIALTGGSRFSISGPTAAFVVILMPIAQQFGLGGLLMATLLSGLMLIAMALARLGRLIEYIPEAVTLGFTAGIAIVIATLQIDDFLGLGLGSLSGHYWHKAATLLTHLGQIQWPSAVTGVVTLAVLIGWRWLGTGFPAHLPALLVGTLLSLLLTHSGYDQATIGSRFSFTWPDGSPGQGIPPFWPDFVWPWQMPGADGKVMHWGWASIQTLLPAAFSIAMLGAIESLLCAVVLDGMTGSRHSANSELMGQGIGNVLVPFFGGITATAAIARSAANFRAGAQSPLAAAIHALVVMAGLLLLAPLLAHLPMAAMAALLLLVAWNISEADKLLHFVRTAPRHDILVMLTCLSLTVLFDMVLAIAVGIVLAALLFMQNVAAMTRVTNISQHSKLITEPLPPGWQVFKINGPLFFAAAERIFAELTLMIRADGDQRQGIVLYMDGVTLLDAGGLTALSRFIDEARHQHMQLVLADLQFQPLRALARSGLGGATDVLSATPTLAEALTRLAGTNTEADAAPATVKTTPGAIDPAQDNSPLHG
jgi:sulfate permease, SulP family